MLSAWNLELQSLSDSFFLSSENVHYNCKFSSL